MYEVERFLGHERIERIAERCNLISRRRILDGLALVEAALEVCGMSKISLEVWACAISISLGTTISRQAIHQRFDDQAVAFFEAVLCALLLSQSHGQSVANQAKGTRILLQDSTIFPLPQNLADVLPGSANQSSRSASVRVQLVLELSEDSIWHLRIEPYSRNDQAASCDILHIARAGDIVIRDLGYFTLDSLKGLIEHNVGFISRLRMDVKLLDVAGETLDLLKFLRKNGECDCPVLIGAKAKLPVRLVARRVAQEVGASRRRKLRSNRDKRLNPSQSTLQLQDWNIFITNVESEVLSREQIEHLYRCRWRIETVFKTWKRGFNPKAIDSKASAEQALIVLYAHLLRACLSTGPLWELLRGYQSPDNPLSLQKAACFVQEHLGEVLRLLLDGEHAYLQALLRQHCTYERRHRPHYKRRLEKLKISNWTRAEICPSMTLT